LEEVKMNILYEGDWKISESIGIEFMDEFFGNEVFFISNN
jgi:hypothetical protein